MKAKRSVSDSRKVAKQSKDASQQRDAEKSRKRHHGTILRRTQDPDKKFSDGVRSTFASISKYWWKEKPDASDFQVRSTRQTMQVFLENFAPVYQRIQKHYGGISPDTNLEKKVSAVNSGNTEMPFYLMRAYADYVGIPTGLLLLFTNLMSDATQEHSKETLINLLTSSRAALDALIVLVNSDKINDLLFEEIQRDENGLEYVAKLGGLEAMARAFKRERKAPKKN